MTTQVTVNPNIGCKYPGTVEGTLVRSMATVIRVAANHHAQRIRFTQPRNLVNPDPNEGNANPWRRAL